MPAWPRTTPRDRIVYNKNYGALYYDNDGNGAHAAIQIATLSKMLKTISYKTSSSSETGPAFREAPGHEFGAGSRPSPASRPTKVHLRLDLSRRMLTQRHFPPKRPWFTSKMRGVQRRLRRGRFRRLPGGESVRPQVSCSFHFSVFCRIT